MRAVREGSASIRFRPGRGSTGGAGGSDETTETISLNFGAVELTYTRQEIGGAAGKSVPVCWNIPAGNDKWG